MASARSRSVSVLVTVLILLPWLSGESRRCSAADARAEAGVPERIERVRDTEVLLVPLLVVEAAEPLGVDARRAGDVVACAGSRPGLFVAAADML
jgi:hypothetical protein